MLAQINNKVYVVVAYNDTVTVWDNGTTLTVPAHEVTIVDDGGVYYFKTESEGIVTDNNQNPLIEKELCAAMYTALVLSGLYDEAVTVYTHQAQRIAVALDQHTVKELSHVPALVWHVYWRNNKVPEEFKIPKNMNVVVVLKHRREIIGIKYLKSVSPDDGLWQAMQSLRRLL